MRELLSFLSRLPQRLQAALAVADAPPQGLYSISLPLTLPAAAEPLPPMPSPWFYWNEPSRARCRLGLGAITLAEARGTGRLEQLASALADTTRRWDCRNLDACGGGPLVFTGFAFDPEDPMQGNWRGFPNAILAVPELLLRRDGDGWSLTLTHASGKPAEQVLARWLELARQLPECLAAPAGLSGIPTDRPFEQPEQPDWLRLAGAAASACADPGLDKVVLARRVRLTAETGFSPSPLLSALAQEFPNCHLVAASLTGKTLVSASPERLLSLDNSELCCDAVGGTLARADELMPAQSANTPKLLREHQLVVEAITQALMPVCGSLDYPRQPRLLRLRDLLHLWTEIRARVCPGQDLLSLAARLHPTPAVNGAPRAAALDWLRRHEPFRRGWYAGGGGWIDPAGNGELAVLLRSALLDAKGADLYAGAGILADSDPTAEFAETELKLRAMQHALQTARAAGSPRRAAGE